MMMMMMKVEDGEEGVELLRLIVTLTSGLAPLLSCDGCSLVVGARVLLNASRDLPVA